MRRSRSVLLAAPLVLVLAACGGTGGGTATVTTTVTASSATTSAPTSPTTSSSTSRTSSSTTSTTSGTTTRTPTRTPSPTGTGALLAALEKAAAQGIEVAVSKALADAGITLSSGPECTADLALDRNGRTASGTVACTGSTDKDVPMTATFVGAVGGGQCSGTLTVSVAGKPVAKETGAQQCGA